MKIKKITALLLALLLVAALFAGCDKQEQNNADEFAYVPTYVEWPFDLEYVNMAKVEGDTIYIFGEIIDGKTISTYINENGEEESYEYDNYVNRLCSMKLDGSEAKELKNYDPDSHFDSDGNSWGGIANMFVDENGNINLIQTIYEDCFELPDDFDSATDEIYDYYTGTSSCVWLDIVDSDGNLIETKKIIGDETGIEYINEVFLSKSGNWYIFGDENIYVADPDGNKLYGIETSLYVNEFVELSDGTVGFYSWDDDGDKIFTIDDNKKDLGEEILLPSDILKIIGSNEKYDLIYRTTTGLYGYSFETGEKEILINWIDADINTYDVDSASLLENGDVLCITQTWENGSNHIEIVTVAKKNASDVPAKKTITMAVMYINYNVNNMVIKFNKANTEYHIKVVNYDEYNTDENTLGTTKLNTEIISGNVPDIICTSGIPVARYSSKGVFEDLIPYIENSIGMENLVEPFFNALKDSDGKLYEIYSCFSVSTAFGLSKVVGDGSSWTFDDLNAAMEKMPEDATIFNAYYTKDDVLSNCISRNIESFVNWGTGECNFDSEEFIGLLEFANSFADSIPEDYSWSSEATNILEGKQLLMPVQMSDMNEIRASTFYSAGKDIAFVGYPTLNGNGNTFSVGSLGFAMSSKSEYKDAVWEFISQILTEEYWENDYQWGLPTNKAVFDELVEEAMTPDFDEYAAHYVLNAPVLEDEEDGSSSESGEGNRNTEAKFGESQINEQGWYEMPKSWAWTGGDDVPVYAMTEYEYNVLMDLINSTTSVSRYDENIVNIISEEVQAYFQGQKTVEDTAKMVQSRVKIYVNEQK